MVINKICVWMRRSASVAAASSTAPLRRGKESEILFLVNNGLFRFQICVILVRQRLRLPRFGSDRCPIAIACRTWPADVSRPFGRPADKQCLPDIMHRAPSNEWLQFSRKVFGHFFRQYLISSLLLANKLDSPDSSQAGHYPNKRALH